MAQFSLTAPKIIIAVEIIILVTTFVTGLVVTISLSLVETRAGGGCLLYATRNKCKVDWNFEVNSPSVCSYCEKIQIASTIMAFLLATFRVVMFFNKLRFTVFRIVSVPLHVLFTIFILAQACLVTVGLETLCKSVARCEARGFSCSNILIKARPSSTLVHFMDTLRIAEDASWVSTMLWFFMVVLGIFALVIEYKCPPVRRDQRHASGRAYDVTT